MTCRQSTFRGETTNTGTSSTTVVAHIDEFTFGECDCGGAVGTAHFTTIANGTLEVHSISGSHDGTMTGAGTEVTINCTELGVQCIFGSSNGIDLGTVTSGTEATVDANANVVRIGNVNHDSVFVCGGTAVWEAK